MSDTMPNIQYMYDVTLPVASFQLCALPCPQLSPVSSPQIGTYQASERHQVLLMMDDFPRYRAHEADAPTRVESIPTESSSSESRSGTAQTPPLSSINQLPIPNYSSEIHNPRMQSATQEDHNAFASTSAQPAYYPMPTASYMSFQAPFHSTSPPPEIGSALHSRSPSPAPIPIPNPSASMPVPIAMPLPDLTPPVHVVDVHDSGIDFGPGVRAPSRNENPEVVMPQDSDETALFRSRSLLGFAKSQSRLGFVKPRPPTITAFSESSVDSDSDSELNLVLPRHHTYDESTRALVEVLRPIMESCIEIVVRLIPVSSLHLCNNGNQQFPDSSDLFDRSTGQITTRTGGGGVCVDGRNLASPLGLYHPTTGLRMSK
ncbi:hypothetical protein EV360DRAFT_87248 [Lentinula raphanica]|nr:hypothetical protein EV360DRAFT_87248 [Lentinula raphanica]